jgi:hypothetical protein
MRSVARLHADEGRLEVRKKSQDLTAPKPSLQSHSARLIDAVHLEHILSQIEPNYLDRHHARPSMLLTVSRSSNHPTVGKSGAVHLIMTASDHRSHQQNVLASRGPSTHAPRFWDQGLDWSEDGSVVKEVETEDGCDTEGEDRA